MKRLAYYPETNHSVENMMKSFGYSTVETPDKASLIVFTGGPDIHASLYGGDPKNCYTNDIDRDLYEIGLTLSYRSVPKLGICRGAQLLCVASGGKLIQDMNHAYRHNIKLTKSGRELQVNSTHHQMMYTAPIEISKYTTIAVTSPADMSAYHFFNNDWLDDVVSEPEIVFFKETNALAIQGHPERAFNNDLKDFKQLTKSLIKELEK